MPSKGRRRSIRFSIPRREPERRMEGLLEEDIVSFTRNMES